MRTTLAVLAMVAGLLPASAKDLSHAEAEGLFRRFVENQRALRTFRATFEQTVSLAGLRNPAVSQGTFSYRAPDAVRIDYTRPAGDFFLLTGDQFFVARKGGGPRKFSAEDPSARMVVALRRVMQGRPDRDEKMTDSVRLEKGEYLVTLTPREPSRELPEKIENRIDARTLMLKSMTIQLPGGSRMEFSFSDWERNAKVDAALFEKP